MRPCRSTSASSPSRRAPSSMSSSDLSVSAFVSASISTATAVLEAHAEAADDRAVAKRERLRRRDVAVRPQRIGRREDFLGRQVRQVAQPVGAREVGGPPAVRRQHADGQLRARPAQLDRVERARGEPLRRVAQHRHALVPRARRHRRRRGAARARARPRAARTPRPRRGRDTRASPTHGAAPGRCTSSSSGRRRSSSAP